MKSTDLEDREDMDEREESELGRVGGEERWTVRGRGGKGEMTARAANQRPTWQQQRRSRRRQRGGIHPQQHLPEPGRVTIML